MSNKENQHVNLDNPPICFSRFSLWRHDLVFFREMPTRWLLDYDETEISSELQAKQKLRIFPEAAMLMLADGFVFVLAALMLGWDLHLPAVLLSAQPLLLIMVADFKTRIIPDQFTLAIVPCGLLLWLADSLNGNPVWFKGLLLRFLAGLAGAGLLFLCGFLGEKIMQREAMGMGDVKLLAVCGFLISLPHFPMLLILSFFSAAFIAVPLLIRRRVNPETGSDMAFGPYIALASLLVLLFNQPFARLWESYLDLVIR